MELGHAGHAPGHSIVRSSSRGIPKRGTVGASTLAGANQWCTKQVCQTVQVSIPQREYAMARQYRCRLHRGSMLWLDSAGGPAGHWKHPCCMLMKN